MSDKKAYYVGLYVTYDTCEVFTTTLMTTSKTKAIEGVIADMKESYSTPFPAYTEQQVYEQLDAEGFMDTKCGRYIVLEMY